MPFGDTFAGAQPLQLTGELSDLLKSTLGGNYDITGGIVASSENEKIVLISEQERRQRFGIECKGPFGKTSSAARGGVYLTRCRYLSRARAHFRRRHTCCARTPHTL